MAKMTVEEVRKLANLSKLAITDEEAARFANEFAAILTYVEQLQSVDTSKLQPTSQVTGLTNVTRPDEPENYDVTPDELLKGVPKIQDRFIKVKRIL